MNFLESKKPLIYLACIVGSIFLILTLLYFVSPNGRIRKVFDDKGVLVKKEDDADRIKKASAQALVEAAKNMPEPVPAVSEQDFVTGNKQAPIQLIVYYDFTDIFSARFHDVVKQALEKYGDKISIAWRLFPLNNITSSLEPANVFMCAGEQGQAMAFADVLFGLLNTQKLNKENYLAQASKLSIDIKKFENCLDNKQYEDFILANKILASKAGVNGTPTSFLNGKLLPGAFQFTDFMDSEGRPVEGLAIRIDKILKNK